MSSPARIEANRNNAMRHGLTSARVVIKGESQAEFDALLAGLQASHKPANIAEEALVQQIAANYWRLLRARRIEAGMYDNIMCEAADETAAFLANEKQFDNIRRYPISIENAYHRAIEQLRKLQRDRKQEDELVSQRPKTARQRRDDPAVKDGRKLLFLRAFRRGNAFLRTLYRSNHPAQP